jgi:hypothetical protein
MDDLIEARAQFDLFAAIKGDLVWAHGGEVPEAQRESRRGQRLFTVNVVPLINIARSQRWLTPSQAARMTTPSVVPELIADASREVKYRKALEKGRRAVDVCLERRGKLGVWRAFQTGSALANGERRFRFRPTARRQDGQPLQYCFVWTEDVATDVRFCPAQPGAERLPLHDGSYPLIQTCRDGLKVTVRDVVLNGHTDEWVFLVDLHNERSAFRKQAELTIRYVSYSVRDAGQLGDSALSGPRIKALRHDVQRLAGCPGTGPVTVLPPVATVHYACFAMPADSWPQATEPVDKVTLKVFTEARRPVSIEVPFRVLGRPFGGRLRRGNGGWVLS